jgi:hypothetical protein
MLRPFASTTVILLAFAVPAGAQDFSRSAQPPSAARPSLAWRVTFVPPAPAAPSRQSPPRQSWAARHPVVLGTAIGAGTGAAWQAAACKGSSCKVGTAGLFGAGVGAYTGLAISAIQKAKRKEPVGRGTKIGLIGGAIGGTVLAFLACYGAGGCGGVS